MLFDWLSGHPRLLDNLITFKMFDNLCLGADTPGEQALGKDMNAVQLKRGTRI